jgi:predicted TIM-barrel fold metal-dependent hydrolase
MLGAMADPVSQALRDRALRGLPLKGVHVVDGHCHLGPHDGFYQPANDAAGLVRTLDRIGIARACVFPTLGVHLDSRRGNDLALAAARAFPGRLLPYVVADPHRTRAESEAELERCFAAGARGIKLHTQVAAYPFDGPGYEPAVAFADRHRLPLISHGVGTADALRRTARAFPNAHLVVAHAGASPPPPGAADGVHRVAVEEPNVYLDLASSVGRFGAFAAVVALVGSSKLLYGSDMPWMCASYQIGRVLLAPIRDEDKRRILGGTLSTLLATRQ